MTHQKKLREPKVSNDIYYASCVIKRIPSIVNQANKSPRNTVREKVERKPKIFILLSPLLGGLRVSDHSAIASIFSTFVLNELFIPNDHKRWLQQFQKSISLE